MHYPNVTIELIHSYLRDAKIIVAPNQIIFAQRDGRWLVEWNGDQLAWLAATEDGAVRLAIERKVLALLKNQLSFAVPEILCVSADGAFDVRSRLAGIVAPDRAHDYLRDDPDSARRFGCWMGTALAELHAVVKPDAVPDWLPRTASWPEPASWILERLPAVIGGSQLATEIAALLTSSQHLQIASEDLVLAHTDLGLHNIVLVPDSLQPCGVIDFEVAAYVDRHCDFRYLILNCADTTLLTSACDTYEAATGIRLKHSRILLYNAMSACCYLAFRAGIAPETRWCGRTFEEDIAWTTIALELYQAAT